MDASSFFASKFLALWASSKMTYDGAPRRASGLGARTGARAAAKAGPAAPVDELVEAIDGDLRDIRSLLSV